MGSFRVIPLGSTALRIENPPTYWVAAFFILVTLVGLFVLSGILLGRNSRAEKNFTLNGTTSSTRQLTSGWKMPAFALVLTLSAGAISFVMLQSSWLQMDRQTGQFELANGLPLSGSRIHGSLDSIATATVDSDGPAQRFVLVLKDGQRIGLGAFNDKGGQSQAAEAVKQFLANGSVPHE